MDVAPYEEFRLRQTRRKNTEMKDCDCYISDTIPHNEGQHQDDCYGEPPCNACLACISAQAVLEESLKPPEPERLTGVTKMWSTNPTGGKGTWGFLASGTDEFFVHFQDLPQMSGPRALEPGDHVSFVPTQDPNKPEKWRATKVLLLNDSPPCCKKANDTIKNVRKLLEQGRDATVILAYLNGV